MELQVIKGLKQGNAILSEIQKEVSLEDVELLMQESAEAIEYQNVPRPEAASGLLTPLCVLGGVPGPLRAAVVCG